MKKLTRILRFIFIFIIAPFLILGSAISKLWEKLVTDPQSGAGRKDGMKLEFGLMDGLLFFFLCVSSCQSCCTLDRIEGQLNRLEKRE